MIESSLILIFMGFLCINWVGGNGQVRKFCHSTLSAVVVGMTLLMLGLLMLLIAMP